MLLAHKIELRPTEEQKNTSIRLEVLRDITLINYLNTLADQKTHFHCKLQMLFIENYALLLSGILKLRTVFQLMQFRIYTMLFLIARQRAAIAHQLSNYLTKTFDRIVIEDLNVKGMIKNRKLSRAIADVGFGMLRHFIEYKAKLRKCIVVIADRFFPSSKTTSTLMLRLTIRCHHHRHHRPLNHTPLF